MRFDQVFPQPKPILAMLHLKGDTPAERLSRAQHEADLLIDSGVDGLIVEDYFGDAADVEAVLAWLKNERSHYCYGVNLLNELGRSYELAEKYGGRFMQVDSIAGHLPPKDDDEYEKLARRYHEKGSILILGGVRFKYKPVLSGRSLEEDLRLGRERCDGIVVTGEGTGMNTDVEKIRRFRSLLGDFPLIVGAGLTAESAAEQLAIADGGIVGSCLKYDGKAENDVSEHETRRFMQAVRALREEQK